VDVVEVTSEQKNVNVYHVSEVIIKQNPNDETAITVDVTVQRGYLEASTFKAVESICVNLTLAEISAFMTAAVTGGNTFQEDFKEKIWACLQANETVPTGTIS
jgi:hypothetical protein